MCAESWLIFFSFNRYAEKKIKNSFKSSQSNTTDKTNIGGIVGGIMQVKIDFFWLDNKNR